MNNDETAKMETLAPLVYSFFISISIIVTAVLLTFLVSSHTLDNSSLYLFFMLSAPIIFAIGIVSSVYLYFRAKNFSVMKSILLTTLPAIIVAVILGAGSFLSFIGIWGGIGG